MDNDLLTLWDQAALLDEGQVRGIIQMVQDARGAATPLRRAARRPAPRGKSPGEAFYEGLQSARNAARVALGDRYWMAPDATVWAHLAGTVASFKSARGVIIKNPKDLRIPAAKFWPGGEVPAGVSFGTGERGDGAGIRQRTAELWAHLQADEKHRALERIPFLEAEIAEQRENNPRGTFVIALESDLKRLRAVCDRVLPATP